MTDSSLTRRTILGAIGAVTGLSAATSSGAASGSQGDGRVRTRGCSDAALDPGEWSTGAVTIQACPDAQMGSVYVSASGRVSHDRHPDNPQQLGSSTRVLVDPGQKQTVWYTGTLTGLSTTNDDLNIGIANRGAPQAQLD